MSFLGSRGYSTDSQKKVSNQDCLVQGALVWESGDLGQVSTLPIRGEVATPFIKWQQWTRMIFHIFSFLFQGPAYWILNYFRTYCFSFEHCLHTKETCDLGIYIYFTLITLIKHNLFNIHITWTRMCLRHLIWIHGRRWNKIRSKWEK